MEEKSTNKTIWIVAAAVLIIAVVVLLVFKPFGREAAAEAPVETVSAEPAVATEPVPTSEPSAEPTVEVEVEPTAAEPTGEEPASEASALHTAITASNVLLIEEALVLSGHSAEITEIAFSPDSSLLASASADNSVKVWNMVDGSLRYSLEGHTDKVLSLAFSPDGGILLSGSQDGTVIKWNVENGEILDTITRAHPVRALDLAFSPDGFLFAVANHTGFVELRRTDTGILYKTIVQADSFGYKEDFVVSWGLSFTPDGEQILVGAGRNEAGSSLRIYDVNSYADSELLIGMNVRIQDLQYAPDGESIGVAFLPLSVFWIVDAEDGTVQQVFEGHSFSVKSLAFSGDGSLIVSSGEDNHIYLWDTTSGQMLFDLVGHSAPANSVAFSPDGTIIATGSDDSTIRIWRIADN